MDKNSSQNGLTYSSAGVDVSHTDSIKRDIAGYIGSKDPRVLNGLGPFASLYDIRFPEIANPVLVLKAEEPGSKQKLAMQHGRAESVCHDMINHLVNDIAVMGARPLAVLDTIVCGKAERDTINSLVKGMADACRLNECALVGGETSVQPGVVDDGVYILTSSVAGIVDRNAIIDGSAIREGDTVLAVAANGLHTNGYTLVRALMERFSGLADEDVCGETFLEAVLRPHAAYYTAIKGLYGTDMLRGMAHITGGGIEGNLNRVLPKGLDAAIDLDRIKTLPVFSLIKQRGNVSDPEMLRTFNCGVGLAVVTRRDEAAAVARHIGRYYDTYEIGGIVNGCGNVTYTGALRWQ